MHLHRHVIRPVVVDHHVQRHIHLMPRLSAHYWVMRHTDDRPQPRFEGRKFHGVIVLVVLRAHHPAHALALDQAEELQAIILVLERRAEERHIARPDISGFVARPALDKAIGLRAPRLHAVREGVGNLYGGAVGNRMAHRSQRPGGTRGTGRLRRGQRGDSGFGRMRVPVARGKRLLPHAIHHSAGQPQRRDRHQAGCDFGHHSHPRRHRHAQHFAGGDGSLGLGQRRFVDLIAGGAQPCIGHCQRGARRRPLEPRYRKSGAGFAVEIQRQKAGHGEGALALLGSFHGV